MVRLPMTSYVVSGWQANSHQRFCGILILLMSSCASSWCGRASRDVAQLLVHGIQQRLATQPPIEVNDELAGQGFDPSMEVPRHVRGYYDIVHAP